MNQSDLRRRHPEPIGRARGHAGCMGLAAQYRLDHRNPVNHFLHVGVGWPMVAVAVILLPFRPLWSVALVRRCLRHHVLRPLRVRAECPDYLQATEHAVRDRLGR